jgi:ATP-binding protein involved in chromosome partitioning
MLQVRRTLAACERDGGGPERPALPVGGEPYDGAMASTDLPSTEAAVRRALAGVIDPELGDNIVDLGMVAGVELGPDGQLVVRVALTTAACPLRGQIKAEVTARAGSLPGVTSVRVETSEMGREQKAALMDRARWKASQKAPRTAVPPRSRVIAVSSGKGGVGKSSVSVNLATGLAQRGYAVGVLDADIAGFSVPRMLGLEGQLEGTWDEDEPGRKIIRPLVKPVGDGELRVVSMGFLAGEDEAVMWRGLMLNRAVQHFLEEVAWGDLDYLVVDMPPGTGDIQMGLARMLPSAEVLIVTTPAQAAQKVAARAASMARKCYLRVLGVVENMSWFECAHGERYELFGSGGGQRLAGDISAPLLARIPLRPEVSLAGDTGQPACLGPGSVAQQSFAGLVDEVLRLCPPVQMATCSARLLDAFAGPGRATAARARAVPSGTS